MTAKWNDIRVYTHAEWNGAQTNPTVGIQILDRNGVELHHSVHGVEESTAAEARFHGLILGLRQARNYTNGRVHCYSADSLVIDQVHENPPPAHSSLHTELRSLEDGFEQVHYELADPTDPLVTGLTRAIEGSGEDRPVGV